MKKLIILALLMSASASAQINWGAYPRACVAIDSTAVGLRGCRTRIQAMIPRKFEGGTLQFRGKITAEIPVGYCKITLSAYSDTGDEGHIFTTEKRVGDGTGSFELTMPLVEEVNFIEPKVMLNGDGSAQLTDLELLVDGRPLPADGLRMPSKPHYKADADTLFRSLPPPRTRMLADLCRKWGEIKYKSASVARGEHNMDAELFRLLPHLSKAALKRWAAQFDLDEPLPVYHYYVGTTHGGGSAMFRHEREYADMDYTDAEMKLLAVFRLWNAVRYFAPNINVADNQDVVLEEAIQNVLHADNKQAYITALRRMAGRLNDGHVAVWDKHAEYAPYEETVHDNFRILDGNIAYINIDGIDEFPSVDDFDKVILDMRGYVGDGDIISFMCSLLPRTASGARFSAPDTQHPGCCNDWEDYFPGRSVRPDRRIVLLVDETTISNSEYVTMILQTNPNVRVIGSRTAGADGNVTMLTLPGGIGFCFTGQGVRYPDGTPTQGVGVRIDEVLQPTCNPLDRAVEILEK